MGLIDRAHERIIKDKYTEDFEVGIIPEINNRNTVMFYGTADNIVDPYLVEKAMNELGIDKAYTFPYDHYFMGLAFPKIIEVVRERLREIVQTTTA